MRNRALLSILLAGIVVSMCGALSASAAPRHIEIIAKRFTYVPNNITLKKGEPVVLVFKSQDVAHGIEFKDLNLKTDIPRKGTGELDFTPTQVGTFVGHCVHFCGSGHGEMAMTIHVTE